MSNPDDADMTQPHIPAPPPYPPLSAYPPPPAPTVPQAPLTSPVPPRTVVRHQRQSRRRSIAAIGVVGLLSFASVLGYTVGANHASNTAAVSSGSVFPNNQSQLPGYSGGSSGGSSSGSSSSGSSRQQSSIDVNAIANKVSPAIVNITTSLSNGEAAGTGIVVSSSGLVLTNNHVIADSTNVQVEIGGSGDSHAAKVLGYDIADDVALVQIQNVSGLTAAPLGNSSSLQEGDAVVALGNAGGKGGAPTVVSGTVTGLDQQITAADEDGSKAETLDGLIQVNANIQPGDSGGPLVDADGKVVGMDAAASSGNGGFGFGGQSSGNEGYAIPIEHALSIAKQIQSGTAADGVHIGAHRALLGVAITDDSRSSGFGGGGSGNGATVTGVQSGSGAESAGLQQGDVIVGIDGTSVSSGQELTHAMVKYSPGDSVTVEWVDSSGQSHRQSVELGSGTPA